MALGTLGAYIVPWLLLVAQAQVQAPCPSHLCRRPEAARASISVGSAWRSRRALPRPLSSSPGLQMHPPVTVRRNNDAGCGCGGGRPGSVFQPLHFRANPRLSNLAYMHVQARHPLSLGLCVMRLHAWRTTQSATRSTSLGVRRARAGLRTKPAMSYTFSGCGCSARCGLRTDLPP